MCALGKYAKTAFPNNDLKSKGVLDVVHSNRCGPMLVASCDVSFSGVPYGMVMMDFQG